MRHEIIGRDNRSTCQNSVTKGEFLSLTVSGGSGVSFEHPSESTTACFMITFMVKSCTDSTLSSCIECCVGVLDTGTVVKD